MLIEILLVATIVVVALSLISEHVSPKVAGIISGAPTGTAITLFFLGLSQGTDFAGKTAIFNMVGLVAMQTFLLLYYYASCRFKRHTLALSTAIATAGYLVVAWLLHQLPMSVGLAAILPLLSIPLFIYLFRGIKDVKIKKKAKMQLSTLVMRAVAASLIIIAIVTVSESVGPGWTGLFSAFPTTLFPLFVILQMTYGSEAVHTVIKNVPAGLPSVVAYSLAVSVAYPALGVWWGTVAAYAAAFVYLGAYFWLRNFRRNFSALE